MTENEIEIMMFCNSKKPGDQDQPSKKKQIETGIFKKIINRSGLLRGSRSRYRFGWVSR
jgi:hypothetical protein